VPLLIFVICAVKLKPCSSNFVICTGGSFWFLLGKKKLRQKLRSWLVCVKPSLLRKCESRVSVSLQLFEKPSPDGGWCETYGRPETHNASYRRSPFARFPRQLPPSSASWRSSSAWVQKLQQPWRATHDWARACENSSTTSMEPTWLLSMI